MTRMPRVILGLLLACLVVSPVLAEQADATRRFSRELQAFDAAAASSRSDFLALEKERARIRKTRGSSVERERYRQQEAALSALLERKQKVLRLAHDAGYTRYLVPYINQHGPEGCWATFNGKTACGYTSLAMAVLALDGPQGVSDATLLRQLRVASHTSVRKGITIRAIANLAREKGMTCDVHGPGADLDFLDRQLQEGRLVVALGNLNAMPPHCNPVLARQGKGSHYVLVIGRDHEGRYVVNDPADPRVTLVTADSMRAFLTTPRALNATRNATLGWLLAIAPAKQGNGSAPRQPLSAR